MKRIYTDDIIKLLLSCRPISRVIITGLTDTVLSTTFTDDGNIVAALDDGTIVTWDETGTRLGIRKGLSASLVLTCDNLAGAWGMKDGKLAVTLKNSIGRLFFLTSVRNGNMMEVIPYSKQESSKKRLHYTVKKSSESSVGICDQETGICFTTLPGYGDVVSSVICSTSAGKMALVLPNHTVRVYDSKKGTYTLLQGHFSTIWSVAFSRADDMLVTTSDDRTVRVWDSSSGKSLGLFVSAYFSHPRLAYFNTTGDLIAGVAGEMVMVWNVKTKSCIAEIRGDEPVTSVAFNKVGNKLAIAYGNKELRVSDLTDLFSVSSVLHGTLTDNQKIVLVCIEEVLKKWHSIDVYERRFFKCNFGNYPDLQKAYESFPPHIKMFLSRFVEKPVKKKVTVPDLSDDWTIL